MFIFRVCEGRRLAFLLGENVVCHLEFEVVNAHGTRSRTEEELESRCTKMGGGESTERETTIYLERWLSYSLLFRLQPAAVHGHPH